MAEISAKLVKDLRDKSGAGMADCKKALEEAEGDIEKAMDVLRKRGAAAAAKRADRETKEGAVIVSTTIDGKAAAMVEINCETDFVARNDGFKKFAQTIADLALSERTTTCEALLNARLSGEYNNEPVSKVAEEMTGKIGEKVVINRVAFFQAPTGTVASYIHPGDKLGSIVHIVGLDKGDALGKDIAMQVAAAAPMVLTRAEVPTSNLDKEVEILRQQAINEGKKEQIVDKIVSGRIEKYYQEVVLLEQPFIKDGGKTISDLLAEASKTHGDKVEVKEFARFQLGEK
jgi:elongation factor Ts